ncbi:MAG: hypothetical protein ACSLFO_03050 [Acidimicrobiales bacterium]
MHADDPLFDGDGPADPDDLLSRWADEEHLETFHPRRNWSPVIAIVVVVALVVGVATAIRLAVPDDDPGSGGGSAAGEDDDVASVLDEEAPSLDDLTSEVTIPPGPETGLAVADKGVSIVEDRFDPARREGTFAAIVVNPNTDWLAQGVQVDVQFIGEAGAPVGNDSAFIELVLPGQKVAVAALFFDAPTAAVIDMTVTLDVARWQEVDQVEGGFVTTEVVTSEAEYSGVRTTFLLRSDFPEALTDVAVTAVYRNEFGFIIGGADTFVDRLDPGVDTPLEIALLANISVEQVAVTELYPAASFGYVPD